MTVTIPAGQTAGTFAVRGVVDGQPEGFEYAQFTLGSVAGVVPRPKFDHYLLGMDDQPVVSWSTGDSKTPQKPGQYAVKARLSTALRYAVDVPYKYADRGVKYGTDFTDDAPSLRLHFPANTSEANSTVTVESNPSRRSNGSYTMTFSNPPASADVAVGYSSVFTCNIAGTPPPPAPPAPRPVASHSPPPTTYNPATAGTLAIDTSGNGSAATLQGFVFHEPQPVQVLPAASYPTSVGVGRLAISVGENGCVAGATVFLDVIHNFRRDDFVDLNNNGVQDPGRIRADRRRQVRRVVRPGRAGPVRRQQRRGAGLRRRPTGDGRRHRPVHQPRGGGADDRPAGSSGWSRP